MFSPSSLSRFLLMFALVMASVSTLANGQTISGTIVGTVLDQQGGVLSGVGITATNAETALTYQGVTDAQRGMFVIPEVPPGIYRVRAQFSGFQTQEHFPVRVDVNRVTEEDFGLKISISATVVVVQSAAPMTDINTATQGGNFNQMQIRELPILSRDINNLALLAPGVESVRTFSFASTLVPFAASGSWGRYNNFIVDSVSNNEPIFGGAATQFSNPDIFSDYAILTSVPKAEFGRNGGSTVNVITKSGSSKLHGTAFWFGQDNQFDAMTRADTASLLTATPPYYEQKGGGTVGGAMGKKKDTFFFLSYQFDRSRADLSNVFPVVATTPTSSGLTALKGVSSPSPALASMLSFPSISSVPAAGGKCFSVLPPATPPFTAPSTSNPCFQTGSTASPNPGGYQFGTYDVPQGNLFDLYDHQASARVDRRVNDSNDFYVRYLIDDLNTPQAVLDPAGDVAFSDLGLLPDSRSILHQRTQSALFDERFARSNSLNEVRFSYSRIAQAIGAFNLPSSILNTRPAATIADQFGGFGGFQSNFPSAGTQFTLGQDTSANVTHSNVFEVQENFSLTRGRNFAKMGADFVRTESNILNVPSDLGHYFFGSPGLSGGFAGFINEPTSGSTNAIAVLQSLPNVLSNSAGVISGQGPNELPLRESDIALFIQDDFHARPNVTLSAGLRYERFGEPINGIIHMNPSVGNTLPTGNGNFGPRFGIAWSPGAARKTVIRGGYSIMYNQMPLNIPLLIWQSAPVSPLVTTITATGASLEALTGAALPATGDYPKSPLSWQSVNAIKVAGCGSFNSRITAGSVPLINCSTQNTVSPTLSSPYTQTWSMGIQRELNRNVMIEVSYVGTKGTDLYQRADLNPNSGWNTTCLAGGLSSSCLGLRLNPLRGDITSINNSGLSTYNGLLASLNSRTLHLQGNSLTFTAAYTYSHMTDTDSEIFGPGVRVLQGDILHSVTLSTTGLSTIEAITPFPQTYNNLSAERANSSYDRRNRFVFSEIWGLPTPGNTRAAKAVLGGWNLNGVGTVQSGQPYSPLNGIPTGPCADANGDGALTNDRPNIGNASAPLNSVAILDDTTCRSANPAVQIANSNQYSGHASSTGYIDINGAPISPSSAHFVQVPLGTTGGGNAGRNILTGPGIIDFDFAVFKRFHFGESKALEFRWEVYNVFNHPNPGYLLGNVFASNAQPTPGYAFSPHASAAGVTGGIPENAIDATTTNGAFDFGSRGNVNTGNRTMQFGVHFSF
ncbi:MAG: TonB-dependent receptor [Acidobacteriota bacterium]|nr:TonB-dependent receptor [Acidobacteriota bacterium]